MNIEEPLTKELAQKLMEIKGECRGMGIKSDWEVILQLKGKEGLEKLEAKMAELGYPLKYEEIKTMAFYPIGYDILSVLAMKEIFGFEDKDFERLGATTIKFSFFTKILLQYFLSLEAIAAQVPRIWRQHYTIGEMEISEFSEKERYISMRIKDFSLHPVFCAIARGYISEILKMVTKSPTTCQETKCIFQGDEYHEFLIKW